MRATLKHRLDRIERAMPKQATAPCPSPAAEIKQGLAAWEIVPGPSESLAETWARAMGISCSQLRAQLQLRAGGL